MNVYNSLSPPLRGERVRARGGNRLRRKQPPLTPALSPLSAGMGRGGLP